MGQNKSKARKELEKILRDDTKTELVVRPNNLPEIPSEIGNDVVAFNRKCSALTNRVSAEARIFETTKSIAALRRDADEMTVVVQVSSMIKDLQKFLNLKRERQLDNDQILDIAAMIMDNHKFLSLADISMCFNQVKSGRHGSMFQSLDGVSIGIWLTKTWDDIQKEIITLRQEHHGRIKGHTGSRDAGMDVEHLINRSKSTKKDG